MIPGTLSHCPRCGRAVTWRSKSGYCHRHCPRPRTARQPVISPDGSHWLVPLTRGLFAKVDASDVGTVGRVNWQATNHDGHSYAACRGDYMHRIIMGVGKHQFVDHINGDRLDNRRVNLRACTQAQNVLNRGADVAAGSRFKGVSWSKSNKGWIAQIRTGGDRRHLGTFATEEAAALAYDAAAIEMHGEFVRLNLPDAWAA